jgi:uncharacterized damage-inducible protein DinB
MAGLSSSVAEELANYYEYVAQHVHKWVDPLSQEVFWHNPYPYGNSVGHLLLHLTGNLSYYIGARIADTGYVRHRDLEFTETQRLPKEQVLREFDRTIGMVVDTIRKQSPEDWTAEYSAEREPEARNRFAVLLRCAGHAYHHVGQIIFLSKELAREAGTKTASH